MGADFLRNKATMCSDQADPKSSSTMPKASVEAENGEELVEDASTYTHTRGQIALIQILLALIVIFALVSTGMGGTLVYLYLHPEQQSKYTQLLETYLLPHPSYVLPKITAPLTLSATYNLSIVVCIFSIVFTLVCIQFLHSVFYYVQLNMPHVPSYLPYLGNVQDFLTNSPWDLMTKWHSIYGPIYSFTLLGRKCVSIAHPMYLRTILQSKIRNVKKDVHFAYASFMPILGKGIVTSEGESWKYQRLSVSSVLRHDVLDVIPGVTLRAVQRLCVLLDEAERQQKSVDLSEELRHLTLQVISEAFFSLSAEESNTTFAKMYLPIMEEGHKRVWHPERKYAFFLPSFWSHRRNINRLNSYVSNLIRSRWSQRQQYRKQHGDLSSPADVLDRILNVYETKKNVAQLSARDIHQLRDEMKTFVLAGHETSAAMMSWAFYESLQNTANAKDLLHKIENEASLVFGKGTDWCAPNKTSEDLPSRDELSQLVISEAALKESLRKYSVVPVVSRTIVETTQLGPHVIQPGTTVFVCIQGVHHDPEIWKNPNMFDPVSRFVDPAPVPAPYTFMPFVEGPRNCLGQYLALLESKMVLSLLMHRYNFELMVSDDGGEPKHRYMVPVVPKNGCKVRLAKKSL